MNSEDLKELHKELLKLGAFFPKIEMGQKNALLTMYNQYQYLRYLMENYMEEK